MSPGLPGEFAVSGGGLRWTLDIKGPGGRFLSQDWWNVFAAGKLLATYNSTGTYYDLTDWLGTKRVEVNAALTCVTGFRSLPYGNGLTSYAPTALPQCVDATEQHYTGKERDAESGNDYFEARYYASGFGRFMSPDWSAKEEPVPYAKLDDPQTLNLYAYVRDSPLNGADPDGHFGDWYTSSGTKLGTDGVEDGRVVVVKDSSSVSYSPDHSIIDASESSIPIATFSKAEGIAMHDAVDRSDKPSGNDKSGGMHEDGFSSTNGIITNAPPGPRYSPQTDPNHMSITVPVASATSLKVHVHPRGDGSIISNHEPSPRGKSNINTAESRNMTSVVVGAENSKVQIYNSQGTVAIILLKAFPEK